LRNLGILDKFRGQHPDEAGPGATASAAGIPDQIAKLGQLHDAGVLTDAEFDAKKTELLCRL
jgi:hypothetical protein